MAKKGNRVLNYFKEVKNELKKVVWPSFKQVKNNTLVVIACVLVIGAFIWVLDLGLTKVWTVVNPTEPVEQSTENPAGSQEGTEMTEEEYKAMLNSMLEAAGINFDEATQKYTDAETGAELTEEQVNERLSALMAEAAPAEGEANTETPAEGEANTEAPAEGEANTETPAEGEANTEAPAETPAQ